MSRRDPLDGVTLLLIDGNNLLHREAGAAGSGQVRGLLARLQAALFEPARAIVVLDGHPARGTRASQRVSARLELRHAGSRTADDVIVQLGADYSPAARAGLVVVSDDRALRDRAMAVGCQARRLEWLQSIIGSRAADASPRHAGARPGLGGRMPRPAAEPTSEDEAAEPTEGWRPGRGATRKKGNPRRTSRRRD